jgi:hypothetical protein
MFNAEKKEIKQVRRDFEAKTDKKQGKYEV